MNTNYFNKLFPEIDVIQKYINSDKNNIFSHLTEADGLEYFVILRNGTSFYISVGTNKLPEFVKNDIIYIRKKVYGLDKDRNKSFIDTEVGEFGTDDQISHAFDMEKKFNVVNEFDTGCFD